MGTCMCVGVSALGNGDFPDTLDHDISDFKLPCSDSQLKPIVQSITPTPGSFDRGAYVKALRETQIVSSLEDLVDDATKIIAVHDGTFHADEVLASAMLKIMPEYRNAVILRTRDAELLKRCHAVIDVGGVDDADAHRYDHHQKEFSGVMHKFGCKTKLSSAGLLYRQHGRKILCELVGEDFATTALEKNIYTGFIEHMDGIDNGIEASTGEKNYAVTSTLSSRIAEMNPWWNEQPGEELMRGAGFVAALEEAARDFINKVFWWKSTLAARDIVREAIESAAKVHPSRGIAILHRHCPWQEHLFDMEEEFAASGDVEAKEALKYIVYEDTKKPGTWRVHAVPVFAGSFDSRKKLPQAWCGLKGADLDCVTGVEGGTFVHNNGVFGGNMSREGALEMARVALDVD